MNTVTDLRTELDELAARAPSDESVRRSLTERINRHARRRRTTALIAVAAAVVLVAGGAGIAGAMLSHRSAGPATPTPVVPVPDVPLPPDTALIRHQVPPVNTPVTASPPDGLSGQAWMSAPGRLAVGWFDPDATSADPSSAGYTITASRMGLLTGYADPDDPQASGLSQRAITVGGHPAMLDTAPEGTVDGFGFPASTRISWQLADGRWIHVWSSDPGRQSSPSATLRTFADGITETPQTLNRAIGIGLTLPGHTVDSSTNSSVLTGMAGPLLYLCPPGVDPMGEASGSASTGSGSSNPDGTTSSGSETSSDPTSRCVGATVLKRPEDGFETGPTVTVTVGDTVAHVDTSNGAAWADLGEGLIAAVQAPTSAHLSKADLAALVASVRLSPAVTVYPAQQPQGQGHREGGVASAEASGVAGPLPTLSALPTAQTTLPAAGALVAPAALPSALPFGFERTDGGWSSSWSVTPTSAAGRATVMAADGTSVDGRIRWNKSGPDAVPADAMLVTAGGHAAHQWQSQEQSGIVTHVAWTLSDGSGIEVYGAPGADVQDVLGLVEVITDTPMRIPEAALPQRTVSAFPELRVTFTAGPGVAAAAQGSGRAGSGAGPATPATTSPALINVELCPDGTPPNAGGETTDCLRIDSSTGDTPLQAAYLLLVRPDWKVATVGGDRVYVSPDGRSVARVGTPTSPRTADSVTAGGTTVATADLAAILLSIPR